MTAIQRKYKRSIKKAKRNAGKAPKKNDMVGGSYYALSSTKKGKVGGKGKGKKIAKAVAKKISGGAKKIGEKITNKIDKIGTNRMVKKINKRNGGSSNEKSKNPRFL